MRVLNDYYCPSCRAVHEQFGLAGAKLAACVVCGTNAELIQAAPNFSLESVSGDFPTATQRWEQDYQRRAAKAREHGE